MKQERLTREGIRHDMQAICRGRWVDLVMAGIFAAASATFGLWLGHFGGVLVMFGVLFDLMALALLVVSGGAVWQSVQFRRLLERPVYLYRDKVVGMETKEHHRRYGSYTTYHLHFAGFGEYQIPDANYSWSKEFQMSSYGLYQFTSVGDEFHLVLTKPHTGKVLLAYSDRLFNAPKETE